MLPWSSPFQPPLDPGSAPLPLLEIRQSQVRAGLAEHGLDVLLVTHLPNITYLSNFVGSAGMLLLTSTQLYLLVDFRYSSAVDEAVQAGLLPANLEAILVQGSYDRALSTFVLDKKWRMLGIEASHFPVGRVRGLTAMLTGGANDVPCALVETDGLVEAARLIKDAHEISLLREGAWRISEVAHDVLRGVVRVGRREAEIAADIDWRLRRAGFSKSAFDTIVAAGPNSALPHARPTGRTLKTGDLVVLDFGGVYGGYCVDLTRTVALGEASEAARVIYEAVAEAHTAAVRAAGLPDARTGDVDAAARGVLGLHGFAEYFGHGTGHGLGLEVHEAPRLSRRTEEHPGLDVLRPGMVFTIEPGVYVEDLGGVRIEDDVLMTTTGGCEILTDVPRLWCEL